MKEQYRLELQQMCMANDHDNAMHDLRVVARTLQKGDSLIVHQPVPKTMEKWLRSICKKRGANLSMFGKTFHYKIITVADKEAEKKRQEREREFWDDYYNSPG